MRLLLAEDEMDLNRIITKKLKKEGYLVDSCYDGQEAMNYLSVTDYDGIILDIMMPKADGYEVLQYLRNEKGKDTPVLFLTAKDAIEDRVSGLDRGANDYMIKPFAFDELMARIRSMIRLANKATSSILQVENLTLDTSTHTAKRDGKIILLSAKEYALLEYLMMNKNVILSREKIEEHIWDYDYEGGTNLVDVYISYVRKKVDGGFEKRLIHTVRGSGYVIKEPD